MENEMVGGGGESRKEAQRGAGAPIRKSLRSRGKREERGAGSAFVEPRWGSVLGDG